MPSPGRAGGRRLMTDDYPAPPLDAQQMGKYPGHGGRFVPPLQNMLNNSPGVLRTASAHLRNLCRSASGPVVSFVLRVFRPFRDEEKSNPRLLR